MAQPHAPLSVRGSIRYVHRFVELHDLKRPDAMRGFAIYRTVYIPESQRDWEIALAKLNPYVAWEIHDSDARLDPEPNRIITDIFKIQLFEDEETLKGAEVVFISDEFAKWVRGGADQMFHILANTCILIDEEVFEALMKAPDPRIESEDAILAAVSSATVKLVDGYLDIEDYGSAGYSGLVKAKFRQLFEVYSTMDDSEGLEARCDEGSDDSLHFA